MSLTIGVDATARLFGGGALHLKELLRAWSHEFDDSNRIVVFAREENIQTLLECVNARVELRAVLPANSSTLRRLLWQQWRLPALARNAGIDVLFCPGNISPFRSLMPAVLVLQNAAPFCPSITPATEGWVRWFSFYIRGLLMRKSAQTASRTIFISSYFRSRFCNAGFTSPETSEIIYLGRDAQSQLVSEPCSLPAGLQDVPTLALCVSHLYPYKNLGALIEGYAHQSATLQKLGVKLRIVGKSVSRRETNMLQHLISSHHLDDWVALTGPVPPNQVRAVMTSADFFIFQSTIENCPSTLIEALAGGLPTMCSNADPMPEIAGDAALYFNPFDAQEIGRALMRMATDTALRAELRQKAAQRVLAFPTWPQVAKSTLDVLYRAAQQGSGGKR